MTTIAFTGTAHGANAMRAHSDIVLAAPTDDTPLIQQIHITRPTRSAKWSSAVVCRALNLSDFQL